VSWYNCRYFKEKIQTQPGFRLVLDEFECTNVCFWFIPPSLRGQKEDEKWWNKIHNVSSVIAALLVLNGLLDYFT